MATYSTAEAAAWIRSQSDTWTEAQIVSLMDVYGVFSGPTYDNRGFILYRITGGINSYGVSLGWKEDATLRFTQTFCEMVLADARKILTGTSVRKNNEILESYLRMKKPGKETDMDFGKELESMLSKAKEFDAMTEKLKATEAALEKEIQDREELELTISDLKKQVGQLMDEKKQINALQKDMAGADYQQIMSGLGKYKNDLNALYTDFYEIQKQVKTLQTKINALDDRRGNLAAGLAGIYKEAKKLNLNSFEK